MGKLDKVHHWNDHGLFNRMVFDRGKKTDQPLIGP